MTSTLGYNSRAPSTSTPSYTYSDTAPSYNASSQYSSTAAASNGFNTGSRNGSSPNPYAPSGIADSRLQADAQQLERTRKQGLIETITLKFQAAIHEEHSKLTADLEEEISIERKLQRANDNVKIQMSKLSKLKAQLREAMNAVEVKSNELKKWTDEQALANAANPADLIVPYDNLSEQILQLNAEHLAIEDALYQINKAIVAAGPENCNISDFLKEARKMARRQFLIRLQLGKIEGLLSKP